MELGWYHDRTRPFYRMSAFFVLLNLRIGVDKDMMDSRNTLPEKRDVGWKPFKVSEFITPLELL